MAARPIESMGVPVVILKEGSSRTYGREALRSNMMAARAVAEVLRTTFGPKGMDKMLVDSLGDITITNDGATILDKMDLQHPAAKLLVQISKGQDEEVGDGTKRAVIFAGELLKQAEDLLNKDVHPTIIIQGYKKALERALEKINEVAEAIDPTDKEKLKRIALTSLASKGVQEAREYFAEIAVEAVDTIKEKRGDKWYVDLDYVQIVKKHGGSLKDTKLVKGVILDKEVVHPGMPKRVENAKIAVLDTPLEIEKPELDAEIRITSPEQLKLLLEEKEEILRKKVEKLKEVGANVVITQKGIDEVAQYYLAKNGILAVRRVKRSDLEKVARATGARIISNIEDLTPEDLGEAQLVEERKVGDDKMVFIEGAKNPRAVSILVRGGFERIVDEAERSLRDALSAVADAVKAGKIVGAGGAPEVELALDLREFARKVGGKEQLAVEAFARALEGVVMALVENAGLDPVEKLMQLRAKHSNGCKHCGVDVYTGEIVDMVEKGNFEAVAVPANAIKSGTEAATLILRIDDIVVAGKKEEEKEKKP
ncbi:thermosome subunit [Ignicoccus islandicus DSM 13165]|uniref:Thermosome subunit n=1 Tax=Ignicoccus islandicus DSM 13165 TaxID=940295 RepID=A0A0U3F827_9CREN|nr:thermosome subunit beta [Ignicoccus islandicus]ALU11785.1 thermosome subunit [Ignicoccus islandicus DSM 13165]